MVALQAIVTAITITLVLVSARLTMEIEATRDWCEQSPVLVRSRRRTSHFDGEASQHSTLHISLPDD